MKNFGRVVIGSIAGSLMGAAMFFVVDGLSPKPAHAVDYEKCEAMNKMYGRLSASQSQAMRDVDVEYADKDEDPVQHQKLVDALNQAGSPYQVRMNKVRADYKAAGCI